MCPGVEAPSISLQGLLHVLLLYQHSRRKGNFLATLRRNNTRKNCLLQETKRSSSSAGCTVPYGSLFRARSFFLLAGGHEVQERNMLYSTIYNNRKGTGTRSNLSLYYVSGPVGSSKNDVAIAVGVAKECSVVLASSTWGY